MSKEIDITSEWVSQYNELYNILNTGAGYCSNNRFIKILRQLDPSFPRFSTYMSSRNQGNLSDVRHKVFFDILSSYPNTRRQEIIAGILSVVTNPEYKQGETFVGTSLNVLDDKADIAIETSIKQICAPRVSISYSWDDDAYKQWVLKMGSKLREAGVDVILDQWDLKAGSNLHSFMEKILSADKVLILFTPNYLRKCLERRASVGVEYSIISAYKFRSVDAEEKVIPILCKGTCETSIPDYFQQFIYIDMTNPTLFENQFNSLVMSIYGEPTVSRPPLGKPPSFRSVD